MGYNQTGHLWKPHKQRASETMTRRSTQNGLCKNSGNTVFMRVSAVFLFSQKSHFRPFQTVSVQKKWGTNWGTKMSEKACGNAA